MLYEEKEKHNKKQWANNLIASELVKTNKTTVFRKTAKSVKTAKSIKILHIALYTVFRKASEIHIIESYLCNWFWSWLRYKSKILSKFQAANEFSFIAVFFFKLKIIKKKNFFFYCIM